MIFYGSRHYGKIWAASGQYLSTKFMYLQFLPLIPTGSEFVLEENGSQYRSIPMGLNQLSVLLGYFRVWAFCGAAFLIVSGLDMVKHGSYGMLAGGIGLGIVWLLSMLVIGKLSDSEKAQCGLLHQLTGIACHPSHLPREMAMGIWQNMARQLVEAGIEASPSAWNMRKVSRDEPGLPLLTAYALYGHALEPNGPWGALAETFWNVLEQASDEEQVRAMRPFLAEPERQTGGEEQEAVPAG